MKLYIKEVTHLANYNPDNWVVLKFNYEGGVLYRVLAGWSGGYLDGDSWRMNSGITEVKQDSDYYYFYSNTGSCYCCRKTSNTMRSNIANTYSAIVERYGDDVSLCDEGTDYMNIDYGGTQQ
jgi:hypothetical protein